MIKNRTMKQLPSDEQPYEKCLRLGAGALADTELLAVIIRTGLRGIPSIELSREILAAAEENCAEKEQPNLLKLSTLTAQDLMKIRGIGMVKAVQIKCVVELSRRIAKTSALNGISFDSPSSIADYFMEDLRYQKQEVLILAMFDTKNRLLSEQVLTMGTVNCSLISAREIFLTALKREAVFIILIHNHPSGDPEPSRDDITVTRQIAAAGKMIGILLIDHIIIGNNQFISMKENGIL